MSSGCDNCCEPVTSVKSCSGPNVKQVIFSNPNDSRKKLKMTTQEIFLKIFNIRINEECQGLTLCLICETNLTELCRAFAGFVKLSVSKSLVADLFRLRDMGSMSSVTSTMPHSTPNTSYLTPIPSYLTTMTYFTPQMSTLTPVILNVQSQSHQQGTAEPEDVQIKMEMCVSPFTVDPELDFLEMPENSQDYFAKDYDGFPCEDLNLKQEVMANFVEIKRQNTMQPMPSKVDTKARFKRSDPLTEKDLQTDLVDLTATGLYQCVKCGRIPFRKHGGRGTKGIVSHLEKFHKLDKEVALFHCKNERILKKKEDLELRWAHEKANRPKKKQSRRVRPSPCPHCNKIFSDPGDMNKHVKGVHLNLRTKCRICLKEVRNISSHMKIHAERNRSHLCYLCGKSYYTESELRQHFSRAHSPTVKPKIKNHKCNLCDKSFEFARALKDHQVRHKNKRNYSCDMCDKKFKIQKDLRSHKVYHQLRKDKPFKCPLCEKRSAAKRHIRIHLIFTHKLSKEEANTLAGIKKSTSESDTVTQSA